MGGDALVTVPGALLILQFCLIGIFFVGVVILSFGYVSTNDKNEQAGHYFSILVFALTTIAPLFFAGKFAETWTPIFGATPARIFEIEAIKVWIFLADIVTAIVMVMRVSGWKSSPFVSVLFSMPAFAILLRESVGRIVLYTVLIAVAYGVGLWWDSRAFARLGRHETRQGQVALWVVAVLMLALTTLIGILTRPPLT